MTEQTAQKAPAPAWAQAMKGTGRAVPPASKRLFIIMSLVFFGSFLFLFVLYNLRHSPAQEQKAEESKAQTAIELTPALQPFGLPRGAQPSGGQVSYVPAPDSSMPMQAPTMQAPASPAGMGTASMPLPASGMTAGQPVVDPMQYQTGYQQPARQYRSDMAIVAPIHYRHAMSAPGMALANPSAPAQRQRMYVSR